MSYELDILFEGFDNYDPFPFRKTSDGTETYGMVSKYDISEHVKRGGKLLGIAPINIELAKSIYQEAESTGSGRYVEGYKYWVQIIIEDKTGTFQYLFPEGGY
jgi:hypothetical protein